MKSCQTCFSKQPLWSTRVYNVGFFVKETAETAQNLNRAGEAWRLTKAQEYRSAQPESESDSDEALTEHKKRFRLTASYESTHMD